jgi:hypothetical protein
MTRPLIAFGMFCCLAHMATGATCYIDPEADPEGADGTEEHPWVSWDDVAMEPGNVYLQKRGTSCETGQLVLASDVSLGAYGVGPQPQITITAEEPDKGITAWRCEGIAVRNLDVAAPDAVSAFCFTECKDVLIESCVARDSHWGIRILGGCEDVRILGTVVHDIRDDGIFIQWTEGIEIARCTVYDVNTNFKFPYTSPEEAGGDGIQLSNCDDWHVHHNLIDRTNSGNKFCFISNDEQTHGVLEHNWLRGPLAVGDGGSTLYFGHGGSGVVVRHNLVEGQAPSAIWHHTAGLEVYGNAFIGHPTGVHSYGPEPISEIRDNLFFGVAEPAVGDHFELIDNLVIPAPEKPTQHLLVFIPHAPGEPGNLRALVIDGESGDADPDLALSGEVAEDAELLILDDDDALARLVVEGPVSQVDGTQMARLNVVEGDDDLLGAGGVAALWTDGEMTAIVAGE